jgi:hypothetical protein
MKHVMEHNELVLQLADTFSNMNGEDLARIYNQIMVDQVEYNGDDMFELTEGEV